MRIILAALAVIIVCPAASAQVWKHEYSVGETAEQVTSCNARIDFSDALVVVRIFGDEMDVFFYQNSLLVPPSTELGNVAFSFKADTFVASAFSASSDSATTSAMFFSLPKSDYAGFLNAMRSGSQMQVAFPDGSYFDIQLNQSNQALEAAGACWQSKPTGPAGKNPFLDSSGRNPFN